MIITTLFIPFVLATIMLGLIVVNVFMYILGSGFTRFYAHITRIPYEILAAIVLTFCIAGAYSTNNRMYDIYIILIFGIVAYFLRRMDFQLVPILLGIVLGLALFLTARGGLFHNRTVYSVISIVVNVFRSIPFIILIVLLIPFTKTVVGTILGANAALPALMAIWLSCAWPLSASTSDKVLPRRSGAASPQLSVTGMVAVSVSPRLVKLGLPKSTSSMLSINSDGCRQPASRTAVTVSFPPP